MIISRLNNRGFTLIEVMVAMLITLVGLLGLLQAVSVATEHNLKNGLRDEALKVGEDQMSSLWVKPFDNYSDAYTPISVPSRLRGFSKNYTVTRTTNKLPNAVSYDSRELIVNVGWTYKNESFQHEVHSVRTR